MGTSKGTMPPSNGDWSSLKGDITTLVNNIDIPDQEKKRKLTAKVVSDFITELEVLTISHLHQNPEEMVRRQFIVLK